MDEWTESVMKSEKVRQETVPSSIRALNRMRKPTWKHPILFQNNFQNKNHSLPHALPWLSLLLGQSPTLFIQLPKPSRMCPASFVCLRASYSPLNSTLQLFWLPLSNPGRPLSFLLDAFTHADTLSHVLSPHCLPSSFSRHSSGLREEFWFSRSA